MFSFFACWFFWLVGVFLGWLFFLCTLVCRAAAVADLSKMLSQAGRWCKVSLRHIIRLESQYMKVTLVYHFVNQAKMLHKDKILLRTDLILLHEQKYYEKNLNSVTLLSYFSIKVFKLWFELLSLEYCSILKWLLALRSSRFICLFSKGIWSRLFSW